MPDREASAPAYTGALPAVFLAVGIALLCARMLPIEFRYAPNDLGIHSVVSQQRYPIQQEPFWLAYGTAATLLFASAMTRWFRREKSAPWADAATELLTFAAAVATAFLPIGAAWVCLAAAAVFARWRRAAVGTETTLERDAPSPAARSRFRLALWPAAFLLLATLPRPNFWNHVANFLLRVPDASLANPGWSFLAEAGQHLAWANSIWNGGLPGRDFFCLYGPLFDFGLVGLWELAGKSVAAWYLYMGLSETVAWLCLFALGSAVVRSRVTLLLLPFLLPYVQLRLGLPLLALFCLTQWLRHERPGWAAAAGAAAGTSILYSQEYGFAFLVVAAAAFAMRSGAPARRAALGFFAAGLVGGLAPCAGYFAARGALLPLLRDIAGYPAYVVAGYANLPFPALLPKIPLDPARAGFGLTEVTRLAYAVPLACVAGIALSLGMERIEWRRPVASLRAIRTGLDRDPMRLATLAIALFGLVCFRAALGRSDLDHIQAAMPGAAILVCIAADRVLQAWRDRSPGLPLAALRTILLAALVGAGAFVQTTPSPVARTARTLRILADFPSPSVRASAPSRVVRVSRWVDANTAPGEPVLFLPNDAAYYYLTDRPNPIRFVLGHQIIGSAHRREILRDLRRSPPRIIVWNDQALAVDGIPHPTVLGEEFMKWVAENYTLETRIESIRILRRRDGAVGLAEPRPARDDRRGGVHVGPRRNRPRPVSIRDSGRAARVARSL